MQPARFLMIVCILVPGVVVSGQGLAGVSSSRFGGAGPLGAGVEPAIVQEAYLKASNTGAEDDFGWAMALSGDTLVVGAPRESSAATGVNGDGSDDSAPEAGAAYVFVRRGEDWVQQAYLKASNTGAGDRFGHSVAISGGTIVVGARWESSAATGVDGNQADDSAVESGAAYVFVRQGTTWSQQAYLKASNTGPGDEFGFSVGVSHDIVAVGARKEDSAATGVDGDPFDDSTNNNGAAYVFARSAGSWSQQAYLKSSLPQSTSHFGGSVAVFGHTVVVGKSGWSTSTFAPGAAYVFVRRGPSWIQQDRLEPSNTSNADEFGHAVAMWGDTIVVGAIKEDSDATDVGGDQDNSGAPRSGAAYVFVRDGTGWSQQAYLKPSNTEKDDNFGWSVAVSGDTVVVSTPWESSAATGVDGDGSDESATWAGAAYVFTRSGSSWSPESYLKASNTGSADKFGESVAIFRDTIVVGAPGEDSSATGVDGSQGNNGAQRSGAAYVFRSPDA